MKLYPYTQAIILNDQDFISYGGQTGTSSAQMRAAAYLIAEQQMTNYLDTFLSPTWVTGQNNYFPGNGYLTTDYGYVSQLGYVRALDQNKAEVFRLTGTNSFAMIREDTYGYIYVQGVCQKWAGKELFTFEFAYQAGLPTGTASQPGMLMALTKAAQLVLNEMYEVPANESTADVGVTEYTSLQYSEKRKGWKNTAFGTSPSAAWVARMADTAVKKARRSVMVGRY